MVTGISFVSLLVVVLFAFLFQHATTDWVTAVVLALITVLWVALLAIGLTVVRSKISTAVLVLLPPLMVAAVSRLSVIAMGGAVLLAIFTLLARHTFTRELESRLEYGVVTIFGRGVRLLALGCMIGLLGLTWTTLTGEEGVYEFQVSEERLEPLLRPAEPLIRRFVPQYQPDLTIDEFIQRELDAQAAELSPGVGIPPEQVARSRAQLAEQLGEELTGDETITTIVTRKLNRSITVLTQENVFLVTAVLIAIAYLTLRALLPFVVWPLLGVIALLVIALRSAGLLVMREAQVTTQRLTL